MHKGLCVLYLSKLLSMVLRARVFPLSQEPPPADRIETDGVDFAVQPIMFAGQPIMVETPGTNT